MRKQRLNCFRRTITEVSRFPALLANYIIVDWIVVDAMYIDSIAT